MSGKAAAVVCSENVSTQPAAIDTGGVHQSNQKPVATIAPLKPRSGH
jgi:hypothetical protein